MRICYAIVPYALAYAVLSASSLSAQQSSGTFKGTVTDASGAVVLNAIIFSSNTETSAVRTAVTNGNGIYAVSNVSPGTYVVSIQKEGFETICKTGTMLGANQTLSVNSQLMTGNESTSGTVQAAPLNLNPLLPSLEASSVRKLVAGPCCCLATDLQQSHATKHQELPIWLHVETY